MNNSTNLIVNSDAAPFNDAEIRRALLLTIDRKSFIDIINQGQAAIISLEAITKRPVVRDDDAIAVRSVVNLCLSFDHRILDGAQAAGFLRSVVQRLEGYGPDSSLE